MEYWESKGLSRDATGVWEESGRGHLSQKKNVWKIPLEVWYLAIHVRNVTGKVVEYIQYERRGEHTGAKALKGMGSWGGWKEGTDVGFPSVYCECYW